MSQVRVETELADHVWQDKRAKIASTIDQLGDHFKTELRAAWLAYIHETYPYPDGPDAPTDKMGGDVLEVDD